MTDSVPNVFHATLDAAAVHNLKPHNVPMPEERERKIYARRPCIVLQDGIVVKVPWCKYYTDPLPLIQFLNMNSWL